MATTIKQFSIHEDWTSVILGFLNYWINTKNNSSEATEAKPTLSIIWERFPKFLLGFIGASLLFFFFVLPETREQVKDSLKNMQGIWIALALSSIGLETKFKDLWNSNSKKPFYAFSSAQAFNVIITLIIAFVLFGR